MPKPREPWPPKRSLSESFIFYSLILILVVVPLPYGAVYQWSWAGLGVTVGLLLLLSLVFTRGRAKPELSGLWLPGALYLIVALWVALQASDMTPHSWHHPIWAEAAETLGEPIGGTISINPVASQSDFFQMLTYAGIFWLAATYGRTGKRALIALWILGLAGVGYAVYGLVAQFSDLGAELWFYKMPQHRAGVSSTFVNRNMYVDYAAFSLLSILAIVLFAWLSLGRKAAEAPLPWLQMIVENQGRILPPALMAVVVLAALVLTGSRGGVLASAVASLGFLLCLIGREGIRGSEKMTLGRSAIALVALWGIMFVLAGLRLGSRLADQEMSVLGGRIAGYKLLASAIREAPLTGYGAGNARDVFYLHNDGAFWTTFNYSHNLYLGTVIDLGIPAAVALIVAVGLIARCCFKGIRRRQRNHVLPALGVSVTTLVAVHGLVDSPLYLPANAATFSFLLGIAYAHSWPSQHQRLTVPDEQ